MNLKIALPDWSAMRARLPSLGGAGRRFASSSTAESTLSEMAWQRRRRATTRWAVWGAVLGTVGALVAFAPAAWLARGVDSATGGRLLLADARGTVWNGSAVLVLTGGPDSRDASALPGRLRWSLGLAGTAIELRLNQACCLNGDVTWRLRPGLGRVQATLVPSPDGAIGQWPAAWLSGLGTPWNTLQLGGQLRLSSAGLSVEWVQGRLRINGGAAAELAGVSSRLATIDPLGSYRLSIQADAAAGDAMSISLLTLDGALQLNGTGQWTAGKLRFRGQASAAPGSEAALNNLLNIIGRRQGALAVITIG